MSIDDFRFVIFNGRDRSPEALPFIERSYAVWEKVWSEHLKELNGTEHATSDDFTRKDEQIALYRGEEAIASIATSVVDLTLAIDRSDSYFKLWTEDELLAIARRYPGPRVMIGCQFTIDHAWRREQQGVSIKRLMMALTIEHLNRSACDLMVGTMRCERGMHSLSYDFGARKLREHVPFYTAHVDLLTWDKHEIRSSGLQLPLHREAIELYDRALDFRKAGRSAAAVDATRNAKRTDTKKAA